MPIMYRYHYNGKSLIVTISALTGIYWVVPESVRWLIANGRIREANEIIILASSANKLQVGVFEQNDFQEGIVEEAQVGLTFWLLVVSIKDSLIFYCRGQIILNMCLHLS